MSCDGVFSSFPSPSPHPHLAARVLNCKGGYRGILTYVRLGPTKALPSVWAKQKLWGVLHDLSTDNFGIIKRAKHRGGDLWKSAFEWEQKENLEESTHFHQTQSITMFKYYLMSRCCLHGKTSEFFVTARHK